jgi:hemolysin III
MSRSHNRFESLGFVLGKIKESGFLFPRVQHDADELGGASKRMQSRREELANTISHAMGLIAALVGAPILLMAALCRGVTPFFVGTIVFVTTMLALYLGSTLYHAWPRTRTKSVLQVFDHAAIFFLIAGTYTPFTLRSFGEVWGATLFALVWALAIFGALVKITRGPSRHPKLAMSLYLGTGWLGLVVFRPMSLAIPPAAIFWLFAGGIAYTAGVLFFIMERFRYGHFAWHLFVVAGTTCHFLAIFACCAV